ncbi:RNA polymerase sigma factor SigJ [Kribbella speibonae]|uniref:RNA polymerase sigma factor SigJ n=1 Tax=Kribbella speibonae TaxID=1572660 RepID=UPI00192DB7B9|nr:RNA polymerase sigma factor SigJ [Kribbella speibonae]
MRIGAVDDVAEFEQQRPRLFGIAYRMLGEASEAEDVVQDAYLRWRSGHGPVQTPAAWLTTVVTNLCINRLTSARARRERYVGPWLPEPVATGNDPQELVERRDTVSLGFLVLMEKLTPPERAVFVLREAFGYTHRDSAEVLGIDEGHARQLYHRALGRLGDERRRFDARPADGTKLVERFIAATVDGDVKGLEAILTEDAAIWADGGDKAIAAREPIFGRSNAAHYLAGLAAGPRARIARLSVIEVNTTLAVLVHESGALTGVLVPEIHDGAITTIRAVLNPDKLAYLRSQLD